MTTLRIVASIAFEQCRRIVTTGLTWTLVGVVVCLSLVAVTLAEREWIAENERYAELLGDLSAAQLRSGPVVVEEGIDPALRALRPPPVGAIVAHGRSLAEPTYWDFSPAGIVPGPALRDWGEIDFPDLEFVVRVFGGLLAVLLGAHAVLGARSNGWLWTLVGLPLQPWHFIVGVIVGQTIVMWAGTALCLLGVLLAERAMVGVDHSAVASAVLWATPAWFALQAVAVATGVGIGARVRTAPRGYLLVLAYWLGPVWLAPVIVDAIAEVVLPTPPRSAMQRDRDRIYGDTRRAGEDEIAKLVATYRPGSQSAVEAYLTDHHEALDAQWRAAATEARTQASAVESEWRAAFNRRQSFSETLRLLLPGASSRVAVAESVNTGPTEAARWQDAVDRQQSVFETRLFDDPPRILLRIQVGSDGRELFSIPRHPRVTLAAIPLFKMPPSLQVARLSSVAKAGFALAMHFLLASWLAITISADHCRPLSGSSRS